MIKRPGGMRRRLTMFATAGGSIADLARGLWRSGSGKRSKASAILSLTGIFLGGSASAASIFCGLGATSAACCLGRNARTEQVEPSGDRIVECSKSTSAAVSARMMSGENRTHFPSGLAGGCRVRSSMHPLRTRFSKACWAFDSASLPSSKARTLAGSSSKNIGIYLLRYSAHASGASNSVARCKERPLSHSPSGIPAGTKRQTPAKYRVVRRQTFWSHLRHSFRSGERRHLSRRQSSIPRLSTRLSVPLPRLPVRSLLAVDHRRGGSTARSYWAEYGLGARQSRVEKGRHWLE